MIAWALATRGDYDPDLMAYIARRSMDTWFGVEGLGFGVWDLGVVLCDSILCLLSTRLPNIIDVFRVHYFVV